jgi:hypothetical protein
MKSFAAFAALAAVSSATENKYNWLGSNDVTVGTDNLGAINVGTYWQVTSAGPDGTVEVGWIFDHSYTDKYKNDFLNSGRRSAINIAFGDTATSTNVESYLV